MGGRDRRPRPSGGAPYRDRFGERVTGTGAYADLIGYRFRLAARRLGLDWDGRRSAPRARLAAR